MLYILYAESLYKSYDENRLHSEIYNDFIRYIQKKYSKVLSDYGRDSFRDIPKLKKLRKESDYSDDIINEKKYNTDFKDNYIEIEKYINIVIKKIKEKEKENE